MASRVKTDDDDVVHRLETPKVGGHDLENASGGDASQPTTLPGLLWAAVKQPTIIMLAVIGLLSFAFVSWLEAACILFAVLMVTLVTALNDSGRKTTPRRVGATLNARLFRLTLRIGAYGAMVALVALLIMCVKPAVLGFGTSFGLLGFSLVAVTVLSAAIPVLPLAATVARACATRGMRNDRHLVRQADAVETMGGVTTVCVTIEEPVGPEVAQAMEDCARAGVTVRLVTGDSLTTAQAIATQCGIARPGDGAIEMEGHEFRRRVLDASGGIVQDEFDRVWPRLRVLALSTPEDKHTLVRGLMQSNSSEFGPQVVAVTASDASDGPALQLADVGLAMGGRSTEAVADIVLMGDTFGSIVDAIKWGRNMHESVAKSLQLQVTVSVVAITLGFIGAVLLFQSPLQAVQMLWVNLIVGSLGSLALSMDAPTPATLSRKPCPTTAPLLSKKMVKHILGQSVLQLIVLLVLTLQGDRIFYIPSGRVEDLQNLDEEDITDPTVHMTLVFNTFVWMALFNQLNARKVHDETSVLAGLRQNRVFLCVALLQVAMQFVAIEFAGAVLYCLPLTWDQWLVCVGLGALSLPWGYMLRKISVKRGPKWMSFIIEDEQTT